MSNGNSKRDRDPFDERYGQDSNDEANDSETSKNSKSEETAKRKKRGETAKSEETEKSEETVRDRKNVNMYLPEQLVDDLQMEYARLNVRWKEQHSESLTKNRDFYPAVIRSAINDTSIAEELDLDDQSE